MRLPRIIVDILLFIGIFWLPWWMTILFAALAVFFFNYFLEIIIVGLLIDALYAAPVIRFYHFEFVVTILALVLFGLISFLKRRLRFYA